MAQSLDEILKELDAGYDPSRQLINQRLAALPGEASAAEAGLNATKDSAFNDITNAARDRGMGFSGIPSSEQAKYISTDFLPAVARVKQASTDKSTSLLDALNNVNLDQRKTALGIQSTQQQMDFQREQAAAAARAAAASNGALSGIDWGGAGGGPGAGAAAAGRSASAVKRSDGGWNFTNAQGKAISAAQYSQLKGVPFRTLLQQMASAGDAGAKMALNFVGNDYGYNSGKVGSNQSVINTLNALLWGVNSVKAAAAAKAAAPTTVKSAYSPNPIASNPLALRR